MSEKRKHKRSMLVSYFDTFDENENAAIGYLVDISYGGLMLISKQPVDMNSQMALRVDLPEEIEGETQLNVSATSVRCVKDMDFDYFNTGFAFEKVNEKDRQIIDYIIALYEL